MRISKFVAGICVTLLSEIILIGVIVYGAWKFDTQK